MHNLLDLLRNFEVKFVSSIPDLLKCVLCKHVLSDSYLSPCGCKFCHECIKEYLGTEGKMCPGVKDECSQIKLILTKDVMKDPFSDIEISYLLVECPHDRCTHQCQLRRLNEHMQSCLNAPVTCVFSAVGCKETGLVGSRLRQHMDEFSVIHAQALLIHIGNLEADFRQRLDQICGKNEVTAVADEILPSIEKGEQERIQLRAIVDVIDSELAAVKREQEMLTTSMRKSIQENMTLIDELKKSRNDMGTVQMRLDESERKQKMFEMQLKKMHEDVNLITRKHQSRGTSNTNGDNNITTSASTVERNNSSKNSKRSAKRRKRDTSGDGDGDDDMESRRMQTDDSMVVSVEDVANSDDNNKSNTNNDNDDNSGGFTWRIKGISSKYHRRSYEHSQPFYSGGGTRGYKMCLCYWMSPSGLRLTFYLLRGDNDNRLVWPMPKTVLIEIIDEDSGQSVLTEHFSYALATCKSDSNDRSAAYDRPTIGDMNPCSDGIVYSVTYKQIKSLPGAIQDDTLTVRCRVLPQ